MGFDHITPDHWLFIAIGGALVFELAGRLLVTRWLFREIARLFVLVELGAVRVIRKIYPPRFVVTGACNMRGDCCTMIIGDPPRFVKDRPLLLGLFAAYHRVMHEFQVHGRGPDGQLVFRCGHLRDDGRCGIYRYRPFICRNYPVQHWFRPPQPLPGCGYGVAPAVVAKMKTRSSLPILNPVVAVHHPTRPGGRHKEEYVEDFVRVDINPPPST